EFESKWQAFAFIISENEEKTKHIDTVVHSKESKHTIQELLSEMMDQVTDSYKKLVELLRSKLSKAEEEWKTLESIETSIGSIQDKLKDSQVRVAQFYVWGEDTNAIETLLK
ncbi:hypothetical protein L9F63_023404, partial [Diploptera punctata]